MGLSPGGDASSEELYCVSLWAFSDGEGVCESAALENFVAAKAPYS